MAATAPHEDKAFNHGIHIMAAVFTAGAWSPVWALRWLAHKADRNREATFEIALQCTAIEQHLDRRS